MASWNRYGDCGQHSLPENVLTEMRMAAEADSRSLDDAITDAVQRYLEDRSWARLLAYGRKQGEAVGITTEQGIDQAIFDWRKEHGELRTP